MITGLKVKTNQEAFDVSVRHIKSLRRRAQRGMFCCYWSNKGESCAIGCLMENPMPVEQNHPGAIRSLASNDIVDIGDVDVWLLQDLQDTHDAVENWNQTGFFNDRILFAIAIKYGLDPREVSSARTPA